MAKQPAQLGSRWNSMVKLFTEEEASGRVSFWFRFWFRFWFYTA